MTANPRNATPSATKLSYDVTSESQRGKLYLVIHDVRDDTWTCDCPHFRFRGDETGTCKHIEIAKDEELAIFAARMVSLADSHIPADSFRLCTLPLWQAKMLANTLRRYGNANMKIVLRGRTPREGLSWRGKSSLRLDESENAAIYISRKK